MNRGSKLARSREESDTQRAFLEMLAYSIPYAYAFHIPNGGSRNVREAVNLKKDGVKAGVADLCVMLPGGRAVFVEVKSSKGRQQDSQKEFEKKCEKLGFFYYVMYDLEDGLKIIDYMKML